MQIDLNFVDNGNDFDMLANHRLNVTHIFKEIVKHLLRFRCGVSVQVAIRRNELSTNGPLEVKDFIDCEFSVRLCNFPHAFSAQSFSVSFPCLLDDSS